MALERRVYPHMEPPFGAFCHAVRTGEWLFVSGLTARGDAAAQQDIVEQTEGVHFRELFDQLPKRFETGDAAMAAVIAAAEEMAKNQS